MNRIGISFTALLLIASPAMAQREIQGANVTGPFYPHRGLLAARPTCAVLGQMYVVTDATAGENVQICTNVGGNTWAASSAGITSLSDVELTSLRLTRTNATTLALGAGAYRVIGKPDPIAWAGGTIVSAITGGGALLLCASPGGLSVTKTSTVGGTVAGGITDNGTGATCPAGSVMINRWPVTTGALDASQPTADAQLRSLMAIEPACDNTDTITYTRNATTGQCEGEVITPAATLFSHHLNLQSAVAMTASPTYANIVQTTFPSLPAGKCFKIEALYNKNDATDPHDVRLDIGGTPTNVIVSGSTSGSHRSMTAKFCNAPASTTVNQLSFLQVQNGLDDLDLSLANASTNPQTFGITTTAPFTVTLQARQNSGGTTDSIIVRDWHVFELP